MHDHMYIQGWECQYCKYWNSKHCYLIKKNFRKEEGDGFKNS